MNSLTIFLIVFVSLETGLLAILVTVSPAAGTVYGEKRALNKYLLNK